VATFSEEPAGSEPWSWRLPNRLTCWASSTVLVYLPSAA
jgi:hypothetical protein